MSCPPARVICATLVLCSAECIFHISWKRPTNMPSLIDVRAARSCSACGAIMILSGRSEWPVMHVTESQTQSSYKGAQRNLGFLFLLETRN
jgi:hypothetical protein